MYQKAKTARQYWRWHEEKEREREREREAGSIYHIKAEDNNTSWYLYTTLTRVATGVPGCVQ